MYVSDNLKNLLTSRAKRLRASRTFRANIGSVNFRDANGNTYLNHCATLEMEEIDACVKFLIDHRIDYCLLNHGGESAYDVLMRAPNANVQLLENVNPATKKSLRIQAFQDAKIGEEDCAVCMQRLDTKDLADAGRIINFSCSHEFHRSCVRTWARDKNTCPTCRAAVVAESWIERENLL